MKKFLSFKFIILGDGGVGKTTLLRRYVEGRFLDTTTMTIGVEFLTKQIEIDSNMCQLILWDISGQERFRFMIDKYIKGASGALVLFDITNMTSFVNIGKWVQLVKKYYQNLPIALIAAKCDLEEFSMVADIYAKRTQKRFEMVDYIKTSAKNGLNVELAFECLVNFAIKTDNSI
ncbi:MAG: Rab family GTPase [Candidatus Heimdallarchaeota archaeon]